MNVKSSKPMQAGIFAAKPNATAIVLALVVVSITGCGAVPQSKYYQLSAPREASSPSAVEPVPVTIMVGPLRASHLYREDRVVYATGDEQMGMYQFNRWAEPPIEMVRELVWRTLRESHHYAGVNLLTSNSRGDFVVQGNLYDFKEISGSSLAARVSMELELRDLKTGATVWTHEYTHDEPVTGKGVPGVVEALNQNVQRGVDEAATSLNEYFAAHPPR